MIGGAILSLFLLGLSGGLIDRQVRATRHRLAAEGLADHDRNFLKRQHRWRMHANIMIGVVGALIAVWPAVPRTQLMMGGYLALLLIAILWMVAMAMIDALAISRRYRRERMEQIAEQARFALESQRQKLATDSEASSEDSFQ